MRNEQQILLDTMTQYDPSNVYHIVSVSGGVPSALTAIKIIERYHGVSPIELVFADTLAEDEDNYRFLKDLEAHTGYTITRLCDGRTPLDIMIEQNVIFTQKFAPCTRILKLEPIWKHVEKVQSDGYQVVMHIGYDLGDKAKGRLKSTTRNWQSKDCIVQYPLVDALIVDPMSEIKRLGITPPRSYDYGFKHANCLGMGGCVKFGQSDMIKTLENFPERYTKRDNAESAIRKEQSLLHLINSIILSLFTGFAIPVDGVLYTHVRDTTNETGQITLTELKSRYKDSQKHGIQLTLFKQAVDLFEDCSTECGVTSDIAWELDKAS